MSLSEIEDSGVTNSRIIAGNALALIVRQSAIWGFNAILVLFLPRYLGDDGLGELQGALSFTALFGVVVALGIRPFLIKEIARDRSVASRYLGSAVVLRLITASILAISVITVFLVFDYPNTVAAVIFLVVGLRVVRSLARLFSGFLFGLENMNAPSFSEIAGKLFVIAVGIPVLVTGHGVTAYAAVLVGAAGIELVLNTWFVSKFIGLRTTVSVGGMRGLVRGGAPFILMAFVMQIYGHADVVSLTIFTSNSVVGWYAAALAFYTAVELIPAALTGAMLPTLARAHRSGGFVVRDTARKAIIVAAVTVTPIAIALSLTSRDVITLLPYPEAFDNSIPLLTILALTLPATSFLTILGTIAIATDRQNAWAKALGATLALNIVLNVILIPMTQDSHENGGIGAAIATIVSEIVMVGFGIYLLPHIVIHRPLILALLKLALALMLIVTAGLAARVLDIPAIPVVFLGMVAYAAAVLAMRVISPDDLRFLMQTGRRFFRART